MYKFVQNKRFKFNVLNLKKRKFKSLRFKFVKARSRSRGKKNKLVVKKKFKVYRKLKIGYLTLKKTHSNYFLTFVDKNFKVIRCLTSGNSKVGDSSRKKRSPYAMEKIFSCLAPYLALYKIKFVKIFLYTKPTTAFFMLAQQLRLKGIKILRMRERIHVAHNGIRRRKLRRK